MHNEYTSTQLEEIFSRLYTNLNYYLDIFYINGFYKDHPMVDFNDNNLYIFIEKIFFLKGGEKHEPIRK